MCGLTISALRFYDDSGHLHPAEVDPATGYRYYEVVQMRTAATISILRAMDLPLSLVSEVVENPDATNPIINGFVDDRQRRREREDRLMQEGRRIIAGYEDNPAVQRRTTEPQPWVGYAEVLEREEGNDDTSDRFNEFYGRLHQARLVPAGHWWLAFGGLQDASGVVYPGLSTSG